MVDLDRTLNESVSNKIRQHRADYNNRPSHVIPFMPTGTNPTGHLHCELVWLSFLQSHRETDRFLTSSGFQLVQSNLHHCLTVFKRVSSQLKSKVGNILAKTAALRINLNIDGATIASRSHTHPSLSQTSRLLSSSLSLGIHFSRSTLVCEVFSSSSFRF